MTKLPKEERIDRLKSIISELHSVSVAELQDLTKVSRMTLHRDLEVLEERGLIEKMHGSVRLSDGAYNIHKSMSSNVEAKQEIARKAATFIEKHDTLFMATGTTVLELVRVITEADIDSSSHTLPEYTELPAHHDRRGLPPPY